MYALLAVLFMLGAVQAKHVEVLSANNEQFETVLSDNSDLTLDVLDFSAMDFIAKETGITRVNGRTATCSCVKDAWEAFSQQKRLCTSITLSVVNYQRGCASNNAEANKIIKDFKDCIKDIQNALKTIGRAVGQYECAKVVEIVKETSLGTNPCKDIRAQLSAATKKALNGDVSLQECRSILSEKQKTLKAAWEICNPSSNTLEFQFQNETAVTPGVN